MLRIRRPDDSAETARSSLVARRPSHPRVRAARAVTRAPIASENGCEETMTSIVNSYSMCYEYVAPMTLPRQLLLPLAARRPRGRRPSGRAGVPHRARPAHCARHPVHVTLRRAHQLPSLREQTLFLALR